MENIELCSKCKGKCCKSMGCHFSPDDFEDLSYKGLKKEIDKGYISIDWWEGNPFDSDKREYIPRALFLRIRNRNADVVNASWGGVCSLLSDTGCTLSYDKRPKGGRDLIPAEPECKITYTKDQCARDWYKYDDILKRLEDCYYDRDIKNKLQTDYEVDKKLVEDIKLDLDAIADDTINTVLEMLKSLNDK